MRRGSLRERVRAAARELGREDFVGGFEFGDLSGFLGIKTRQEGKSLRYAVQDLLKAGDLQRCGDNRLKAAPHPPGAPAKQEIMWRFLRLNRRASVRKLVAVAQADQATVKQFGRLLESRGLAKFDGQDIYLIGDPDPEAPFDVERADRARDWRRKQKEALGHLDGIFSKAHELMQSVAAARAVVSELEHE